MADIPKELFVGVAESWVLEKRLNLAARDFLCSNQHRSLTSHQGPHTQFFNHDLKSRKLRKRGSLAIEIKTVIWIKCPNTEMNSFVNLCQMRRFRFDEFTETGTGVGFVLPSPAMLLVVLLQILGRSQTFCLGLHVSGGVRYGVGSSVLAALAHDSCPV
jgi:hypothetical protein